MAAELDVLIEQLEELLASGTVAPDDALELASVAGMVSRLGAEGHESLQRAVEWRDGPGQELLDVAFESFKAEVVLGELEGVLDPDADEVAVEEALYEVDEVIAAAIWCGRRAAVKSLASEADRLVRQVPEPFAQVADLGLSMARLPVVGMDYDLYAFWMAVADAGTLAG